MAHREPSVITTASPCHATNASSCKRVSRYDSIYFSVVIPTYDRRALLTRCLESIFQQEYKRYEVIVIDDGSTDGTAQFLRSFGDRVRVFRQENRGPGAARNLGIRHAQGDYVAFLDSDDLWFPWTLRVYEEAIRLHESPAFISGVPFCFRHVSELSSVALDQPLSMNFLDNYYSGSDRWRVAGAGTLVVRIDELIKCNSFENERMNAEDLDLVMKLGIAQGYVEILQPVTLGYRTHDHQTTLIGDLNYGGLCHLIDQEQQQKYPGGPERSLQRQEIIARCVRSLSLASVGNGRSRQAWHLYCKTFVWHLRLMRLRYLIGFPLVTLFRTAMPKRSGSTTSA